MVIYVHADLFKYNYNCEFKLKNEPNFSVKHGKCWQVEELVLKQPKFLERGAFLYKNCAITTTRVRIFTVPFYTFTSQLVFRLPF